MTDRYDKLARDHGVGDVGWEEDAPEWDGKETRRRLSIKMTATRNAAALRSVIEEELPGPLARAWADGLGRSPLYFYRPVLEPGRHLPIGMEPRRRELAARVSLFLDCGPRGTRGQIARVLGKDPRTVDRLLDEGAPVVSGAV